jgi:hypothetical protein
MIDDARDFEGRFGVKSVRRGVDALRDQFVQVTVCGSVDCLVVYGVAHAGSWGQGGHVGGQKGLYWYFTAPVKTILEKMRRRVTGVATQNCPRNCTRLRDQFL